MLCNQTIQQLHDEYQHQDEEPYRKALAATRDLDLKVHRQSLPDACSGYIWRVAGEWCVVLNRDHPLCRQTFSLAHEVGHFLLHHPRGGMMSSADTSKLEREANAFAAEFLMPRRLMQRLCEWGLSAEDMATRLGLSLDAVTIRLDALGL